MTTADRAPRVEVHQDPETLATAVAGELLSRLAEVQANGHEPQIAIAGGRIARAIHREVARLSPESNVDWARVVIWWGDERFVEPSSEDRNETSARHDFLDAVGATQAHPMPSTVEAAEVESGAAAYTELMRREGSGLFDVLMLGVGPDGHVASLFPGHPELDIVDPIAVGVRDSPKPPPDRISLTLAALNRSAAVWFLVSGEEKAEAVEASLSADGDLHQIPARGVGGHNETIWFLDKPAASLL